MNNKITELALKAGIGGLGSSKIESFSKVIATRCIEIFEQYDPKYAIKTIKNEFGIEEDGKK